MNSLCAVVALVLSLLSVACGDDLTFPPGFKFGVASSSYQIEGAWNVSDKGESIWDRYIHNFPERIMDHTSGDVACDSYHLWRRDVEMIEELGAHFYRFSISWPRLLPTGFPDHISEDGKNYYNNLIDGLLEKGIEPVVTLYHWDLPQSLQNLGGWANPLISEWFADYARVAYSLYADRVKTWLTINEPVIMCDLVYNTGIFAPGIVSTAAPYLCNKNVLVAHARAWRIYDQEYKNRYHGKVSINNQLIWFEPSTEDDQGLVDLAFENCAGRYTHPIYSKEGGWPPAIEKMMADISRKEGLPRSKLPAFTEEEIELVKGTFDFYAMNHYTSRVLRKARPNEKLSAAWPMFDCPDLDAKVEKPEEWKVAEGIHWFWVYPEGMRRHLAWLKNNYGDLEIMIMENGYASKSSLDDKNRVAYYRDYLKQVLLAIKEDGVNVTRYTAWTLMDNFEWVAGYDTKFGLYEVDFSSPQRTRTPRASAKYYAEIIKSHSVPPISRDEL